MRSYMRLCRSVFVITCALAVLVCGLQGETPEHPQDYDARISALEQARSARPGDLAILRTLADSYGAGALYDKAITVVQEILAIGGDDPEYSLRLARLYAWSGKSDAALQQLNKLGERAGIEAKELECNILSVERRAADAASCYAGLLPPVANDSIKNSVVLLALARNQAWAGRSREATSTYDIYLRIHPEDRTATIELIRISRFRGDYLKSEKLCNALLEKNPADAEVLALKAEVLHWAGHRKITAHRSADQAAALDPELPDAKVAQVYSLLDVGANRAARQQFSVLQDEVSRNGGLQPDATFHDAYRLLESEIGQTSQAHLDLPYSTYNDVDGVHDTFAGLAFTAPITADHQLNVKFEQYVSSAPWPGVFTAGHSRSAVREFMAGSRITAMPGVLISFAGGGSTKSRSDNIRPIFNVGATLTPADHWSFDFSAGRDFLKLTPRAIDLNMSCYQAAGTARYAFDSRTSLSIQAEQRWWSDNNRSLAGGAILDRTLHYYSRFLLHGGFLTRHDVFARDTRLTSGFFTPDHYQRHEAHLGANGEAGRLRWELQAGGGAQQIMRTALYQPSWDVTSSFSVRLTGALRFFAKYQRRNYSLLAKDGWYQGFYFNIGIQP
jgi:tetratricopeptide (TPR) repeat protein